MIEVEVRLFGNLREKAPGSGEPSLLTLPEGATVDDLLNHLEIPRQLSKLIFVNGVRSDTSTRLKQGDRVGIFPPVAGG